MNQNNLFKALATSALVAMTIASAGTANAASVTYHLDQSNILADGIAYLKVTISDSMVNTGDIDFKVETTSAFTAGTNFGVQAFGFNPSVAITSANIYNLNSKWKVGSGNLGGFGSFAVAEDGTGSSRQSPLTFSVHFAGDSINSYANSSTGSAGSWVGDGKPYFAAHVAGFTSNVYDSSGMVTSDWFAGNTTALPSHVPVPTAAWLLASGLIGLVGVARHKKQA
jgi:hypothetical protein